MDAPPTFRPVSLTASDAQALAVVEQQTLNDSAYTPDEMLAVLGRPEQRAYLAWIDGQAVGYVSCFVTGGRRLEVDMLGVLKAYRGRGIAVALIGHALVQARESGISEARAVVALGNAASRAAFERAGFRPLSGGDEAPLAHAMLVYSIRGLAEVPLPEGWEWHASSAGDEEQLQLMYRGEQAGRATCLRVQTLCYSGLWLERLDAASDRSVGRAARAVVERAKQLGLDEVGYLAPQSAPARAAALTPRCLSFIREGYVDRGDYVVYRKEVA